MRQSCVLVTFLLLWQPSFFYSFTSSAPLPPAGTQKITWKDSRKASRGFFKGSCAKKDLLKVNSVAGGRNQFKIQKSLERTSAEPSPDKTSSRLVSRHRPDRNPAERCTAVASGKKQDKDKSDRISESLLAVEWLSSINKCDPVRLKNFWSRCYKFTVPFKKLRFRFRNISTRTKYSEMIG